MRERVLWNDLQVICGGGDEFHGGGAVEAGRENDCLVTRKNGDVLGFDSSAYEVALVFFI
jgi:hypothetical protein